MRERNPLPLPHRINNNKYISETVLCGGFFVYISVCYGGGGFTVESVTQSSKTAGGLFFSSTVSQDLVPALPGWSIMFRDK